jgi:hypothetical protein
MSAYPNISTTHARNRPQLVYSAGFDLVELGAGDREALAGHCRSLSAMRTSIGPGTLGELYNVPPFGQADLETDHVVAARVLHGPLIASAQVHRVSRLLAWGELWYTAWPGDWAHGACGQCVGRAVRWARRSGLACLVAYTRTAAEHERELLARAGFVVSLQGGELVAELDLLD